jgi:hypothetical protein
MLTEIALLEGMAENLAPTREASVVRTKLQEARLAEFERLRTSGQFDDDGRDMALREAYDSMETALVDGRRRGIEQRTDMSEPLNAGRRGS